MAKLATTGSSHADALGGAILALVRRVVKLEDHDIRTPIFGMGRVVEISRVVEINMPPAVLHEIQQRAHKENASLGQAITTLVKRAIKSDLIGLH